MAEQENAEALMLNSKRQRRPSVRLGEIGDFPVAFTIDRPLKQRKKRRVAVSQPPAAALPEVGPPMFDPLLGEDHLLMDVDMDADVDMTGFNLDDSGAGSPWETSSRVPRTRPLEHVSNESPPATAAAAPEEAEGEAEAGAQAEEVGGSKGKEQDGEQKEGSLVDGSAGEAIAAAEEQCRSVENEGEEQQEQQQQQLEEDVHLDQEQEQEANGEEAEVEKQQQGNGIVKKGRTRTLKAKYGRRKKSSSSRTSAAASQRAKKSAVEATRRASKNAVESGASEGECNGGTSTKSDDDKEAEDRRRDRQEELENEKEEGDGGNSNKQDATAAPAPSHRVTRGSKSLPKDADYPSKSQHSSKVEKNLRSSRSRAHHYAPPLPPPPSTTKESKGDEPDSSGDDEQQLMQQQPTLQQTRQRLDEQNQDQQQQQQRQQQRQGKQQQENGAMGDNSSGDTGAGKEQAEQEHESFVLPEFVKKWLYERRLGKYVELFEFHEVDEDVLPLLTMDDLRDMGIIAIGARRKMFQAIQELG